MSVYKFTCDYKESKFYVLISTCINNILDSYSNPLHLFIVNGKLFFLIHADDEKLR